MGFDLYAFPGIRHTTPNFYHPPSMHAFTKSHPNAQRLLSLSLRASPSLPHFPSNQVIRQEEIRNTFPHNVLVPTVRANQLSGAYLRLHQQDMQVLQQLLVGSEVLWRRGVGGEGGESELGVLVPVLCLTKSREVGDV